MSKNYSNKYLWYGQRYAYGVAENIFDEQLGGVKDARPSMNKCCFLWKITRPRRIFQDSSRHTGNNISDQFRES